MTQSFSNPSPADDSSFANNNKPGGVLVQVTDVSVIDVALSRLNVNSLWYSETPYGINTFTTPDRVQVAFSGINPGGLKYPVLQDNTEYEWYFEITETGGGGTFTSSTYSFTVGTPVPSKAITPAPTNAATDVTLDQATLTWVDGGDADTFDVYYGTESGNLGDAVSSAQAGASFTVTGITDGSPYSYIVTRYWRIDSTNAGGTTTGDEWSFTTIRFDAPGVNYFYHTTGQYYRLLVQSDGTYGDVPGVGVENTDYVFLSASYEPNFISTQRKLVSVANSKVWIEDI